jgi:Cys-tRNA(Pro)/Cys-tRNA(Cys) deacylase
MTAIAEFLTRHGVPYRLHTHAPLVSFADGKALLPFDANAMVKGLVFRRPAGAYAIVALRGADRADYKKIATALGLRRDELTMASADQVVTDLGMQPGGVTPLPIAASGVPGADVLIDRAVLELATIYCGSGRNDATLEIAGADLVRVSAGRIGDFAKRV